MLSVGCLVRLDWCDNFPQQTSLTYTRKRERSSSDRTNEGNVLSPVQWVSRTKKPRDAMLKTNGENDVGIATDIGFNMAWVLNFLSAAWLTWLLYVMVLGDYFTVDVLDPDYALIIFGVEAFLMIITTAVVFIELLNKGTYYHTVFYGTFAMMAVIVIGGSFLFALKMRPRHEFEFFADAYDDALKLPASTHYANLEAITIPYMNSTFTGIDVLTEMPFHALITVAASSLFLVGYTSSLLLVMCVHSKTYRKDEWDEGKGACTGTNAVLTMMAVIALFYLLVVVAQIMVLVMVGEAWVNPSNDWIEAGLITAAVTGGIATLLILVHVIMLCVNKTSRSGAAGWLWFFTDFMAKSLIIIGVVGITQAVVLSDASVDWDNNHVTKTYISCVDTLRTATASSVSVTRCTALISSVMAISFRTILMIYLIIFVTTRLLEHSQFMMPLDRSGKASDITFLPMTGAIVRTGIKE